MRQTVLHCKTSRTVATIASASSLAPWDPSHKFRRLYRAAILAVLRGVSKSVQILFNSIEAMRVLTLRILK